MSRLSAVTLDARHREAHDGGSREGRHGRAHADATAAEVLAPQLRLYRAARHEVLQRLLQVRARDRAALQLPARLLPHLNQRRAAVPSLPRLFVVTGY
jgi:hypothetical protein